MREDDLTERTKRFALRIIELVSSLPNTFVAAHIGRQLLKAGTSVGANYREAKRARSKAEFVSKIGIVEQEADESLYWLQLLELSGIVGEDNIGDLIGEADELVSIFVSIGKSSKR
jgi:four helix bundle protein